MKILYLALIQPLLNIYNGWQNIFNDNIQSLNKIETNNYSYVDGYIADYENIAYDWQQVGHDMQRVIIN